MDISQLKPPTPGGANEDDGAQAQEAAAKRAQEEQMKRDLLSTVLESDARERLSRIALVNPQLSNQIEGVLLRMAQSGQLRGRVTEAQLIGLLDQADAAQGKSTTKKSTVVFQRRKGLDDDDWDI